MFSGVFDRHANLKVVCTEYDVGWVAIMYEQANYRYGRATAYGSDEATPTATGWVALAVRLPATFATAGAMGAPVGKVVAADSGRRPPIPG